MDRSVFFSLNDWFENDLGKSSCYYFIFDYFLEAGLWVSENKKVPGYPETWIELQ